MATIHGHVKTEIKIVSVNDPVVVLEIEGVSTTFMAGDSAELTINMHDPHEGSQCDFCGSPKVMVT